MASQVDTANISVVSDEHGLQRWSDESSLKHAYGAHLLKENWDISLDIELEHGSARIDIFARDGDQVHLIKVEEVLDSSNVYDIIGQIAYYRQYYSDARVSVVVGQVYMLSNADSEVPLLQVDGLQEDGFDPAILLLQENGIELFVFDPDDYYETESDYRNPYEWMFVATSLLIGIFLIAGIVVLFLTM